MAEVYGRYCYIVGDGDVAEALREHERLAASCGVSAGGATDSIPKCRPRERIKIGHDDPNGSAA